MNTRADGGPARDHFGLSHDGARHAPAPCRESTPTPALSRESAALEPALSRESAGLGAALSREYAAARRQAVTVAGLGEPRVDPHGHPEVTADGTPVAPGVWVASADRTDLGDGPVHPDDLAEAATRPAWHRPEFLAGRHLLRRLLRRVRPDLAALPVHADPAGKPRLHGAPDLALPGITVSHDGERIAAAVCAHGDVGVDVQLPPDRLSDSAVRRCLGSHAAAVAGLPRLLRAKEFAWVWTVQEACVKAAGTGMSGRPWSIDVPPGALSGRWGGFTWLSLRTRSPVPLSCAFHPAPHR
ncbi:4'-phosphopantetheinyl transferase family protein [Amycolatopsis sp. cmx-4-83]|uniref:4'-phosphopantetheinyl transferase family protein n=1 Tax=Amycolatopsis sp. cmx-4-83 TaxID=2790940 RepID=UPI00397CEF40